MAEWDDFLTDLPNELLTEPIEQNNNLNLLEELDEWMHSNSNNNTGQNNVKEAESKEANFNAITEGSTESNISDTNDNIITQQNKLKELLQQQLQKPNQQTLNSQQQTISFSKLPTQQPIRPLYVQNNNKNNQLQSMHISLQQPQQQFKQLPMPQQLIVQSQQPKVIFQPAQNIILQQPFKQQLVNMPQNHVNLLIKNNCDSVPNSNNNNNDDYVLVQLGNQIFKINKNQQNPIFQQPNQNLVQQPNQNILQQPNQNILQQPNQNILQSQQLKILQQQLNQQKITLSQKQHKIILQRPPKQTLVTTSATQPPSLNTPHLHLSSTPSTTTTIPITTSTQQTTQQSLDQLLPTSKMTLKSSVNITDQTRQQKLERHLLKDQRSATFPELHTKFETLRDTVRCLVPYHVMACGADDDDEVQKAEEKFEMMCRKQIERHNTMLNKFQRLLLVKSMKHVDASEEVMMGRLFVLHERDRLKKEKQAVLNNEKFRPRPCLSEEEKLKYAHIIESFGDEDEEEVTDGITRRNTIEVKRGKSGEVSTENQAHDQSVCSNKNDSLKANVDDAKSCDRKKGEEGKTNDVNHNGNNHEIDGHKAEDTPKNFCTDRKFTNLHIKDKILKENKKDMKKDRKQKFHNVMGNVKRKEDLPADDAIENKLGQFNEKEINLKQKKVGILAKIFNKHKNTTNHSKSNGLNNDSGLKENGPYNNIEKTKSNSVNDSFDNSEVCLKRPYTTTFNKYNKDSTRISKKKIINHPNDNNVEHADNNADEAKNGFNSLVIRIGKHKKRLIEKIPTIKIVRSKIHDGEDDELRSENGHNDECGEADVQKENKIIEEKDFKSKIRLKLNRNFYKNDELYSNSILKTNSDDEYDEGNYNDKTNHNDNNSITSNDDSEIFVKKDNDTRPEKFENSFKSSKKKHKDKKIVVKEIFQGHHNNHVANEQPCHNAQLNGSVDNDKGLFKLKISKENLKMNIDATNNLSEEDLAVANLLSNQNTNGKMDTQHYNIFGGDQFNFMDDIFPLNQDIDYNKEGRTEDDEDETESAIKNLIALQ